MKILFMGTPDFAAGILEAVCKSGRHEVVMAVTQPDRPKGRSKAPVQSPVKEYALTAGIPVMQPEKIKSSDEVEKLRAAGADIFVVAAFGQILSKEILDIPKYGCINVHASLLPEYRGAAPIQWAIADGKKVTGVTIQRMNEGVDTGDIITNVTVDIRDDETGGSLFDRLMEAGKALTVDTLSLIEEGRAVYTPQDESRASHAKILKKEMGHIDFSKAAEEIERLIRAFTPWPGGYTFYDGKMLKIKKCSVTGSSNSDIPGTVTAVSADDITVSCKSGALLIKVVQPEGKKEMSVHDYLLGNSIPVGTRLG